MTRRAWERQKRWRGWRDCWKTRSDEWATALSDGGPLPRNSQNGTDSRCDPPPWFCIVVDPKEVKFTGEAATNFRLYVRGLGTQGSEKKPLGGGCTARSSW